MNKIKCNKCFKLKNEKEFNSSDLEQRRYTCKLCKREQRKKWKTNKKNKIDLCTAYLCKLCGKQKIGKEFYLNDLTNSTFICKKCRSEYNNQK